MSDPRVFSMYGPQALAPGARLLVVDDDGNLTIEVVANVFPSIGGEIYWVKLEGRPSIPVATSARVVAA